MAPCRHMAHVTVPLLSKFSYYQTFENFDCTPFLGTKKELQALYSEEKSPLPGFIGTMALRKAERRLSTFSAVGLVALCVRVYSEKG